MTYVAAAATIVDDGHGKKITSNQNHLTKHKQQETIHHCVCWEKKKKNETMAAKKKEK